eukprot:TRINITY_DN16057_c0_g1_i1.p1 TRINITY_DN16057_c0_g1~~TRINITY_DN16057_c0_g1_i1.p1  ORF type:complete len:219 (-),score=38.06 TRINITY_DN16057_c0_g1_i1:27-683(-)
MVNNEEYIVKLLIVGNSGVGKSSIIHSFIHNTYKPMIATVGIDNQFRTVEIDGHRVKLQLWDTPGQEVYKTITKSHFQLASGIILVFDSSDESSFQGIRNWVELIEQTTQSVFPNKIILGNKCDKLDSKVIDSETARVLADEYQSKFFETSAASQVNIEEAIMTITRDILILEGVISDQNRRNSDPDYDQTNSLFSGEEGASIPSRPVQQTDCCCIIS